MARTYTRAEIRTRVRQRADVENDTHVTDTEIDGLIDVNYPKFWDILTASAPPDYFSTTQTITTVAGTLAYALPADFYKTRRVVVDLGSSNYRPLEPLSESLIQSFRPVDAVHTVLHYYTPNCAKLASDASTIDGYNGWEELLVLDCAIDIKAKREEPSGYLVSRRNELMQRIVSMAPRDFGSGQVVQRRWTRPRLPYWELGNEVRHYRLVGSNIELYRAYWPYGV